MTNYSEIINNYKIQHMQIQTIDSCDSKCIMCPHKDAPITNKKMENWVFEKIIKDTKEAIAFGRIEENICIRTFLHNESLLDSDIFRKIEYIKEEIPTCTVIMNTNGFMMPEYKEEIINSGLDEFTWSSYGDTEVLFKRITGISKTQNEIDEILESFEYINNNAPSSLNVLRLKTDKKIISVLNNEAELWSKFHSRAGFYKSKKTYNKIYGCATKGSQRNGEYRTTNRNLSFLNFFANGDSNLCCQDWYRETVMGNIKEQTILEIMNSEKFMVLKAQTLGADSPDNFICKRCEFASPDPEFTDLILSRRS